MAKRAKPEEIIAKLREVEVRLSRGETTGQAVRTTGVKEQTRYRWRRTVAFIRAAMILHPRKCAAEGGKIAGPVEPSRQFANRRSSCSLHR